MTPQRETIAILDYGSQYTQLIARRVRELNVYCQVYPWNKPEVEVMADQPMGFVLSGGPNSVYEPGAPSLAGYVLRAGVPILGLCYGMQLLAHALGGQVVPAGRREYGPAQVHIVDPKTPLFTGLDATLDVCGCHGTWTPSAFIDEAVGRIRAQVGTGIVVCGLSGGVDSAVAATLIHRAVGDQLTCVFVNTGMLRLGEPEQVIETFRRELGVRLVAVDATEDFLKALQGTTDPEQKRHTIGDKFVRVFEREAARIAQQAGRQARRFLGQGTIYPDVIESAGRPDAQRIKSHHNVGGLPPDIDFELVEPLRDLFKDEVRRVGEKLGLSPDLIWRHPFPGPGLAVRVLGEITWDRLERLRAADAIWIEELRAAGCYRLVAQAFAVLLPVRTVGVMGDGRTYQEVIALRAVTTDDFMTASWAQLPHDLLARVSTRIVNEVRGVNRVVYDISSKPPATIEWE